MKFLSFALFALCSSLTSGQLLYANPQLVSPQLVTSAQVREQVKYPLPYAYQYANQQFTQQQPLLLPQNLLPGQVYNPTFPAFQQYGLTPQFQPGFVGQPTVVEQIDEVIVPNNPTKVVSAAVEAPLYADDNGDIQDVLASLMTQAANVHAEEYYYARGEPLTGVVAPGLRRATAIPINLRNPIVRSPGKKPFTVKKNKHFELYKYQ